MSLRVFLVDDEAPARARLCTLLGDILPQCPNQVVGQAENGREALPLILQNQPDLVVLDVQMPGMSGLELAAHLRAQGCTAAIVFVTAFDEYALQAFEVHALDYLVKPVRAARLAQTLARVAGQGGMAAASAAPPANLDLPSNASAQGDKTVSAGAPAGAPAGLTAMARALAMPRQHFSVQERGRVLLVPVKDVLFLRAEQKYVTLKSREREYLIEESLTSIEEEMAGSFVRVHRNALVARDAILGVERGAPEAGAQESWQVILRDCAERLPISRRQWPVIKALVR